MTALRRLLASNGTGVSGFPFFAGPVDRSARVLGQGAVQLQGGIAMTLEYKAGHYFKRLTMLENLFGDTEHHLRAVSDAGGLVAAD